jgi:hypothetical protein
MDHSPFPYDVTARIWESIRPVARGARYEDPLEVVLKAKNLGELDGGGSQLGEGSEIVFVEIELCLSNLDDALEEAKTSLEASGAPEGSEFLFQHAGKDHVIPFGLFQGMAIILDGVTLPDEVYAQSNGDALMDKLNGALGSLGEVRNHWDGPRDTVLYAYGRNADEMFHLVQPVLIADPQCQNARVLLRFGNPALPSHTIVIPHRDPSSAA